MSNVVLRPVVFTQYISDPTIAIPATFVAPSSGISAWSTGVAEMVKVVPLNVPGIIFASFKFFEFANSLYKDAAFGDL